ncbi:MAG: DUF892 family protein [Cyclobacteriaceae bacterium]
MKPILDLSDLMVEQLRELFDAELQLVEFLNKMRLEATNYQLIKLVEKYQKTTDDNQWVLRQIFNDLFVQKRGEKNESIRLMEENSLAILKRCRTGEVRDAAIIISLQHIIHFKIASYGAVATYANIMHLYNDAQKLHQIVELEKKTDRLLAMLADGEVDRKAFNYA